MMLDQTLRVSSVAGLLWPSELEEIRAIVRSAIETRRAEFEVTNRDRSVHRIDGETLERAKEVYEPDGRIEFDELPIDAAKIVEAAVLRRIDDIRTFFPNARCSEAWFYVEYAAGQHITPHVDYPHNELDPSAPKIAALSVLIDEPDEGGEFFVETYSDRLVWNEEGLLRPDMDFNNPKFREARRARWTSSLAAGDAVLCGTQMVHGTEPVRKGTSAKLIGFLMP
jgi:hypothetical protein